MKLVLVSLAASDSPETLPLGAACVAASIRAAAAESAGLARLETEILEAGLGETPDDLASRIASSGAGIVGFSVYSWNRGTLAATSDRLRGSMGPMLLFAGGPEATADPEGLIAEASLDFAIVGEGETATARALEAVVSGAAASGALGEIPGVVLGEAPKGGRTSVLSSYAPPEDPAEIPSPWLLGVLDPMARGGDILWELSRGCPFSCAYCYESKGSSGARPLPMARVEAELDLFVASGVRHAFVLDPTFDFDPRRAGLLLDLFRAKAPGMRWKFEVRAELLEAALVRRFAALDCSLQIGLQSLRTATLDLVGRPGFDRREFARKAAMLSRAGVSFGLDLIYGLPGDRLADFEEGLDFALGLEPNHLDVFPLAVLPGTELADRAVELGIEADARPPYLVRSTRELPAPDLARAASLSEACARFYGAGRAVAWFKAALAPLKSRPSAFLRSYWSWLARQSAARADRFRRDLPRLVEEEQLAFLRVSYAEAGQESLLPALGDLVRLHAAWGRALAEGERSVLSLSYDPEELLGAAVVGLRAFVRGTPAGKRAARWAVVPDDADGARISAL